MDDFWEHVYKGIIVAIFAVALWVGYVFVRVVFSNTPSQSNYTCACGEVCACEK